jgi:hypothetical protein
MDNPKNESVQKCLDCAKEFSLPIPPFQIINRELVSMLVFAHPERYFCPHCMTEYEFNLITMRGAVFGFKKKEIQAPGPQIVIPEGIDTSKLKA